MATTVPVVFAFPYDEPDGSKSYAPTDPGKFAPGVAAQLVRDGIATFATEAAEKTATKPPVSRAPKPEAPKKAAGKSDPTTSDVAVNAKP